MKPSQIVMIVVIVDVLITLPLVLWILRRRWQRAADATGLDLGRLRDFTAEIERTVEEHVRSHWSGDPSTLPLVLTSLLATLESRAREEGYPVERSMLKRLMANVITSKQLASGAEVREALKQVA